MNRWMLIALLALGAAGLSLRAYAAPAAKDEAPEVKVKLEDPPKVVPDTIKKEVGSEPRPKTAGTQPAVTVGSVAYDPSAPAAHNPCYDQKGLWPEDVKKTAYYKEKWEPARLLVWAKRGNFKGPVASPENWLEYLRDGSAGQPPTKGPDAKTDVVFPDGNYTVEGPGGWEQWGTFSVRHLTQGKGVRLNVRDPAIVGNFWQFEGPRGWHIMEPRWVGNKHAFARNENRLTVGFKIPSVNKTEGASVEFLGFWNDQDGWVIQNGVMILGPDTTFRCGDRHVLNVEEAGTLIMMSGSTFQLTQRRNMWRDLYIKGKFLAETPERPLTRDAAIYLNDKTGGQVISNTYKGGILLCPQGSMAVNSADPTKARLVFALAKYPPPGNADEQAKRKESEKTGKIDMALYGKVDFNGVEFNDIRTGGIEITGQAVRAGWKNVFYGKNNEGEPDTLFTVTPNPANK